MIERWRKTKPASICIRHAALWKSLVRMTVTESIQFDLAAEFVMAETAVTQPAPQEFSPQVSSLRSWRAR